MKLDHVHFFPNLVLGLKVEFLAILICLIVVKPNSVVFCSYDYSRHDLMYCVGKGCVSWWLIELNNLVARCIEEMKTTKDADEC